MGGNLLIKTTLHIAQVTYDEDHQPNVNPA
jgi:hypothetical protein